MWMFSKSLILFLGERFLISHLNSQFQNTLSNTKSAQEQYSTNLNVCSVCTKCIFPSKLSWKLDSSCRWPPLPPCLPSALGTALGMSWILCARLPLETEVSGPLLGRVMRGLSMSTYLSTTPALLNAMANSPLRCWEDNLDAKDCEIDGFMHKAVFFFFSPPSLYRNHLPSADIHLCCHTVLFQCLPLKEMELPIFHRMLLAWKLLPELQLPGMVSSFASQLMQYLP